MKTGTIYIIKNTIDEKVYIGQTIQMVDKRFRSHLSIPKDAKFNKGTLEYHILKYGKDKFYYEVLEKDVPEYILNKRERFYIELYDSYNNGLNGNKGFSVSKFSNKNAMNKIIYNQMIGFLIFNGIDIKDIKITLGIVRSKKIWIIYGDKKNTF